MAVNFYMWACRPVCLLLVATFTLFITSSIADERTDKDMYMRREHSFIRPYSSNYWDILGHAMISSRQVRLTADRQSQRGALWNMQPVEFHNWEVLVQFGIHGTGTDGLHGDGIAFWYVKDPQQIGDIFGNADFFTGLAIFIDTYSNHNGPHNHKHPYISAMVNNGTLSYDHDRDGTHTEIAGCETGGRNKAYDTFMNVRYQNNVLTVAMDVDNKGEWKECFTVSGVALPTGYFLGFSAATGDLADNHDIIAVKFYDLEPTVGDGTDYAKIQPSASIFSPPRDHISDPAPGFFSGAWTGFKLLLIIVLVCVAVGVIGMVGFLVFQKRQDNSRKRFY